MVPLHATPRAGQGKHSVPHHRHSAEEGQTLGHRAAPGPLVVHAVGGVVARAEADRCACTHEAPEDDLGVAVEVRGVEASLPVASEVVEQGAALAAAAAPELGVEAGGGVVGHGEILGCGTDRLPRRQRGHRPILQIDSLRGFATCARDSAGRAPPVVLARTHRAMLGNGVDLHVKPGLSEEYHLRTCQRLPLLLPQQPPQALVRVHRLLIIRAGLAPDLEVVGQVQAPGIVRVRPHGPGLAGHVEVPRVLLHVRQAAGAVDEKPRDWIGGHGRDANPAAGKDSEIDLRR
mmetsp:Transcript_36667/g.88106  ORF Transcript_36667/g.88106 Transcript_36667/m.88106 type:complete len:290 (+) Transcript_36667:517-1386(+)